MAQRHPDPAGGYGDGGSSAGSPWGAPQPEAGTPPGHPDHVPHESGTGAVDAVGAGVVGDPGGVLVDRPAGRSKVAAAVTATPAGILTAGEVLAGYLHAQAAVFLHSLRLHRESGLDAEEAVEAAFQLRRSARRLSGALHTFRPLTDTAWADPLPAELAWLSGMLAREHAYAARLNRLRAALHRLSGADAALYGGPDADPAVRGRAGAGWYDPLEAAPPAESGTEEPSTAADSLAVRGEEGNGPGAGSGPGTGSRSVSGAGPGTSASGEGPGRRAARGRVTAQRTAGGARASASVPGAPGEAGGLPGREGDGSRKPRGVVAADPQYGPQRSPGNGAPAAPAVLTVGAARAGALLERQLTLARTRAHSAALQALGSSRFHAVADAVAVLASDASLDAAVAGGPADEVLAPCVEQLHLRLMDAVEALPLYRARHPYNADALVHGLAATATADAPPATGQQDVPWHQVRLLVRLRRYAQEVLDSPVTAAAPAGGSGGSGAAGAAGDEPSLSARLCSAAQAMDRHRDAAAAAAARTPRIAPATAYALGVLHADQRHDAEAARFVFSRLWQRLVANA